MALADGLDLGTGQFDAGLIFFLNEVVVVALLFLATILIPSPRSGTSLRLYAVFCPSQALSITHLRKKHKRKPLTRTIGAAGRFLRAGPKWIYLIS